MFGPGLVLAWTLLVSLLPGAAPIYPSIRASMSPQYIHTSWRIQDGPRPTACSQLLKPRMASFGSHLLSQGMYRFQFS